MYGSRHGTNENGLNEQRHIRRMYDGHQWSKPFLGRQKFFLHLQFLCDLGTRLASPSSVGVLAGLASVLAPGIRCPLSPRSHSNWRQVELADMVQLRWVCGICSGMVRSHRRGMHMDFARTLARLHFSATPNSGRERMSCGNMPGSNSSYSARTNSLKQIDFIINLLYMMY